LFVNKVWQSLSGTCGADIYPYLRKPDLLSSNSCVIRTSQQIILIDAGALPEQICDLCEILKECIREKARPILIYLTHCHIDHSLSVGKFRQMLQNDYIWIGIQEEGAGFLRAGDSKITIAELYGISCPSLQPDILFLTTQDKIERIPRRIDLLPDISLTLQTKIIPTESGQSLFCQKVSVGGDDYMEFYKMPGHSPDSICIRIGKVLFIGDLLAAASPMVAGISGWNKDDLIQTLQQVLWLLKNESINWCYPGHGGIIPADKTCDILQKMYQKTSHQHDLVEMNEDRLFQITDFALELIDEAEEVFSSIAGRLLYVAYQLEELEEAEAADRCRNVMQMDQIDACLSDFRNLCFALDAGKIRRVEFAHSVLHIVQKMKSLFDSRPLSAMLPQLLINRGIGLLLDFIGIANGYRNREEFIPTDLNALLEDIVHQWQSNPLLDASIIDFADDYDKYLATLISRIGYGPVSDKPTLLLERQNHLPLIHIAAARLTDTLLNFLECLRQTDPQSIIIATGVDDKNAFLTILPQSHDVPLLKTVDVKKIKSYQRRFRICGLALNQENKGFRLIIDEHS